MDSDKWKDFVTRKLQQAAKANDLQNFELTRTALQGLVIGSPPIITAANKLKPTATHFGIC